MKMVVQDHGRKGKVSSMANHKTSVFRRLTGTFLLIEILVLVGVGMLLFHFANIQEEEDQAGREEMAVQVIQQLENQIETVYGLADSLSNDTRLSRIAYRMYPDEYERSQLVLGVLDSLRSSTELNASIEKIEVTFPQAELLLGSGGEYDTHYQYSQKESGLLEGFLLYEDGQLKVRISRPLISDLLGEAPDYECTVTFSDKFFSSLLTGFGEGENQGALLIIEVENGTPLSLAVSQEGKMGIFLLDYMGKHGLERLSATMSLEGEDYAVAAYSSQQYPFALVTWRNVEILSANMFSTLCALFLMILVTSALFILLIYQTNHRVAQPIYRLIYAFEQVGKGRLNTRIHPDHNDEFAFIYDSFNGMTAQTEKLINNIKEQHSLLQNAELMQLQAQIDPHFLYNSFNVIKYMANGEEYEQITQFVSALAQYYRFINKEVRQAIPLASEVQHMETYLYIQQMRFSERIHVEVKGLPENAEKILVPKLILQPLVENCYAHGLKNKLGEGVISVKFSQVGRQLYIAVEDNGDCMTPERLEDLSRQINAMDDQSVSHALSNIRRRLELAYGERDMLALSISKLGGLCVTLRFDLDKSPRLLGENSMDK